MNEAKKLRRTSAGGYARGDETRQRIIEAAIELFGERGFAGASTREIAAMAGVNAPALQYYFENKEGVYRACVETIAETGWQVFAPAVGHAWAMLDAHAEIDVLIDAFIGLLRALSDRMFTAPKTMNQRMFFAREQGGQEPASASEILMSRMRKPLNDVSAALIGRISGRPADDPVTRLRALSLFGQLTVFHIAQRSALQLLEWDAFEGERAALLIETIADQTRVLLEQWHVQRDAPAAGPESAAKRAPGAAASKRAAKPGTARPAAKKTARVKKPAAR
ncbi:MULTISPECIES: CerR family C-terminal domain-containing protein [Burkholderia]|uniref:CerR family C-terminal domain-containing protein n=1 Tax=Burkholderia TaxID=32008 RepID=UPI000669A3D3|nr:MULTISPECIES: CerR family C-terminal domain-containing protein [Burkholderia]AOJ28138.1 TetR family transcriptional regulator [Burkholderia seminalis]KVF47540.1 TetR family transcriptional regulator [Burkholderia seminalis]MBN3738380.1 CerR family C-terminal domain-containing protein [Burkholderia sp. Tr-20355]MCA8040030.1 CerR family C-terminal domain-containing protein [Burkholderia seminalis]MCA8300074.1 CerR family C-terminal domain-containing protein [Burkholderia seminalis]